MRKILMVLAAVAPLAGCDAGARVAKQDDAHCQRWGFQPGTAAYDGCARLQEQGESRAYIAALMRPPAHVCRTIIDPGAHTETVRCS